MRKRYWSGLLLAVALGWWLSRPGRQKDTLEPTTERDGVGPATLRRYWLDVEGATLPPEQVLRRVLDNFAQIMPRPLAITWKVKGDPSRGQEGDRYFILMLVRVGLVETEVVEALRFRNRTLRPHPESGWVEFRVIPKSQGKSQGAYRLQVQSSVRTTTRADRLAYLLGMAGVQALNWHTVLQRALKVSGGHEVNRGRDTAEFGHVPGGVKPPQTPGGGREASSDSEG